MTIHCVVGGQFGSEAKGHVAAQLAKRLNTQRLDRPLHLVRVGGSNAGHSAVDANGVVWALRQVPAAAVIDPNAYLYIAQGSEIDLDVLYDELDQLDNAGYNASSRMLIDEYATIIEQRHIEAETNSDINARTGSTSKGIGAARADRLMRKATIARDSRRLRIMQESLGFHIGDTVEPIQWAHEHNEHVIVEGTQGYGLGLHTRFYPQTTSGDCRTVDLLAQIGYTPLDPMKPRDIHTWLVLRTYPIRVAGNSGGMDGRELDWETLGERTGGYIQPERTTVTKKIRRVAEWDIQVVREAVAANGGPNPHLHPCLMFIDYFEPMIAGVESYDLMRNAAFSDLHQRLAVCEADLGCEIAMFGTSPKTVITNDRLLDVVRNWNDTRA